jgi:phage gp37-like protein
VLPAVYALFAGSKETVTAGRRATGEA